MTPDWWVGNSPNLHESLQTLTSNRATGHGPLKLKDGINQEIIYTILSLYLYLLNMDPSCTRIVSNHTICALCSAWDTHASQGEGPSS